MASLFEMRVYFRYMRCRQVPAIVLFAIGVSTPGLARAQNPSSAPRPATAGLHAGRTFWLGIAGGAAGAVIGTRALSFDGLTPSGRTAHEWRAGATYGAIGAAISASVAAALSEPQPSESHPFVQDPIGAPLIAGMGAVQVLDFTSTRHFRSRNANEWLLTNRLVDNTSAFVASEIAAVSAGVGAAYLLHRTGHHTLERVIETAYVAAGVASSIRNYHLPHR